MANKVTIKSSEQRKLHAKSGNRCAMCGTILVDVSNPNAPCLGENAHIYGEKPGAARYDASKKDDFVNSEKNLIFLCCNCHKKIDTDVDSYPAEDLFKIKEKHERHVMDQLTENAPNYTFAELEVLANYIINEQSSRENMQSYSLLNIKDKITKNSLQEVQGYISIGLTNLDTIEDYLNKHPDATLANRLTNAMATKYNALKIEGMDSISIFDELWSYASGDNEDYKYKSAGLGILSYFFEKCEVFEK